MQELVGQRDDVGAAARHLMSRDDQQQRELGIRGLVRDLLDIDSDVVTAVEAVLADRAEAVVVERPSHAISALELLRTAGAGRGIMISLPSAESSPTGFVPLGQPLIERVRLSGRTQSRDPNDTRAVDAESQAGAPLASSADLEGMQGMLRTLLAGVNLVDDLREVLAVYGGGRIPATFVTREGDLLSSDGVIRGGGARGGAHARPKCRWKLRKARLKRKPHDWYRRSDGMLCACVPTRAHS